MFRAIFGFIIFSIVLTILFYVFVVIGGIKLFNCANEEYSTNTDYVGKEVVFKKDTLTIIDYSVLNNTFVMNNGKEFNVNLVKKLKVIE